MSTASKDPEAMIESIGSLIKQINQRVHPISLECDDIEQQYDRLKTIAGGRADHAAMLLGRLRPALMGLSQFCVNVVIQIDGMVADPFQRKVE